MKTSMALDAESRAHVRRYLRRLGPALRRASKRGVPITPEQVRGAMGQWKLDASELPWALALYCPEADFDAERLAGGWVCNYTEMRQQLAVAFFRGDLDFDPFDLSKATGIGGPVKDALPDPLRWQAPGTEGSNLF